MRYAPMKNKTMILLVVAVVCGLVASYLTSRFLAGQNEKVTVLVAKQRISGSTTIKNPDDLFEAEERISKDTPRSAINKPEILKDQILIRGLEKGDIVLAENLQSKDGAPLDVKLAPGKRAVGVRVTQEKVAGGFVMPDSHVDVIHTTRRAIGDQDARAILQDIHVLAVDLLDKRDQDKTGLLVSATVTLEVTPDEALLLAKVQDYGSITLALRKKGDDTRVAEGPSPSEKAPNAPGAPEMPKAEEPVASTTEPETKDPEKEEPKVERKTMMIFNSNQWIRATFTTVEGETETTIERSQPDAPSAPTPTPAPTAGGKSPGSKDGK
jgi:pilus assembly protein CpaB